jgi:exodeoxyribonuclease VII large subunit
MDLFTHRNILTVGQLMKELKKLTEQRFDFVWVEGEISGLRRPGSGHVYFSLKDADASLRAVLFKHQAALVRFELEEGLKVLCQGRMSVYVARGDVQLVVDAMEPRGAGALALAFEQLKKKLDAEGLFDPERKRPLPELPTRIAVVTSPTGAALKDFLKHLYARVHNLETVVVPVLVQGPNAPGDNIKALKELAKWGWPQVIVLTRGGGSVEDLWAYNDEGLARAIADCPIPVLSAVGHEIDTSIADLVADARAATPTAAGELLARPMYEFSQRLAAINERLAPAMQRSLNRRQMHLAGLKRGLGDPSRRLLDQRLRVDDLLTRAYHAASSQNHRLSARLWKLIQRLKDNRPDRRLMQIKQRRDELETRLLSAARERIKQRSAQVEILRARLNALGPNQVLNRGYALVSGPGGELISNAGQVQPGDRIRVRLGRGGLGALVEEVDD